MNRNTILQLNVWSNVIRLDFARDKYARGMINDIEGTGGRLIAAKSDDT